MDIERNISSKFKHFKGKLLFISGPRQVGKTFIVEHKLKPDLVLNMDVAKDRLSFKRFPEYAIDWYQTNIGPFPDRPTGKDKPLIFADEIHKVRGWRNIIKGTFDKTHHAIDYVASGSSAFRLRRQDQGDSLAGRAIWLNLPPVSFREYVKSFAPEIRLLPTWKCEGSIIEAARNNIKYQERLRELWNEYVRFGSFPENLVRKDDVFYKQWLEDYLSGMLDRDLRDLHVAKDVERVYQVFQLLLEGIGSTYSLRSLAGTLGVSPNTIKSDINAIKQVLWGFDLPVASVSKTKQIRKEKKFYPIDFCFTHYSEPIVHGATFECIVACILKRGLFSETSGMLSKYHLGFYRDYSQREVDFVIQKGADILLAVECKLKAKGGVGNLRFFSKHKPKESILLVEEPSVFAVKNDVCILSIELFALCFE
jgi:predicted AAA+ superfamily ATPase